MPITVTQPHADSPPCMVNQPVIIDASFTVPEVAPSSIWEASVNGGPFNMFATAVASAVYTPGMISRFGAAGDVGVDSVQIRIRDNFTGGQTTFNLVVAARVPTISCTHMLGDVTNSVRQPSESYQNGFVFDPDGPNDWNVPTNSTLTDAKNTADKSGKQGCGCGGKQNSEMNEPSSGGGNDSTGGGGERPGTPTQSASGASQAQDPAAFCNAPMVGRSSDIRSTLYGALLVRSGCEHVQTRGPKLDLGVYFSNAVDALVNTHRVAGGKRVFGWQAVLVQNTTGGNVAIYWGDGTVEIYRQTGTMPPTYAPVRGTFGTLTQPAPMGNFNLKTKDCVYYEFDSNGKLNWVQDESTDRNTVYYDWNGSYVAKIRGPMKSVVYFGYDANNNVNLMNLEAPDRPSANRTTYYDYNVSGQMNKIIGPEGCITYFDYNGSSDLSEIVNSDNYRTYFSYGVELIPRISEINFPEGAGITFSYDDTVPRAVQTQIGCTPSYYDYQWAGLPSQIGSPSGQKTFSFCSDGKPEYSSENPCYYVWDSSGNMTEQHCCDDTSQYFTYDGCGNITSYMDPLGRTQYWNYDAQARQTQWIDAKANTTYFERDIYGQMVSKKDRRGNTTYYTYDLAGSTTSIQWPDSAVRYFDYTPFGELELEIDELSNVAYFNRDQRGRMTLSKDFVGNQTQVAYDNRSNRTIVVDRRGNAWYWQYDGLSRNTVQRTALLNTSYYRYDLCNLMTGMVDPRGNPTYYYYDSSKRLMANENALKQVTYFEYNAQSLLSFIKDPRGCTRYFGYDCHHRMTSETDGEGNQSLYSYDKAGNRISITDPRLYRTYFTYDDLNRQTSLKNALSQTTYFHFDVESNFTTLQDALDRRTYYYFDSKNRQFCVEDAQKNRTYFTFEARDLRSSTKDARSNVTYFYQDKLARQFAVRDACNNVNYVEYDAESNVLASKNARSNTTYFAFDADNQRFSIQSPLNEFTYFTFDAAANRTSVQDARRNYSYFYFDALNRSLADEDAKQARMYYTYNASGNRDSVKDPLARITYFYFDCAERNFAVLDAVGSLSYFTFDPSSNRNSVKNERGFVTYLYFDALNRRFAARNAIMALTYMEYDAVGNRTATKDPLSRLNYFYFDTLNRLFASEDGLQKRTYFEFDAVANTTSIRNARRDTVTPIEVGIQYFTYDPLNRRTSLKDEVASVWYFDYDAVSNPFFQRNPLAALTYWQYDADDRKVSQKDPLARTWYWTYDAVGNTTSMKDGKAQVTYYQHDVVNFRHRIDYPNSEKHYFEYDLARQVTAFADPTGRTPESYDNLGRLTFRGNPGGQNLYYQYDAVGNRISLKDPDGVLIYYDFDSVDRMKEVRSSTYSGWISYYDYDLADQEVFEKRANSSITYHGYDAAGRISLIQHRKADTTLIERWDYTRDEVGNVLQIDRGSDSMHQYFTYDRANRIGYEAWRSNGGSDIYGWYYQYDLAGSRSLKRKEIPASPATTYWDYDAADQLVIQKNDADTRVYFSFDSNGNLSVEHDVDASAGRTYYDYDPRNLLTRVDYPQAIATNYFYYNAPSERIRKDDSTGGKKYTWDGIVQIVEKDLSNSTTQRLLKGYTPIGGIGEYTMQDLAGTVIYPHKNQVGTTMRHTDSGQTVVNTYEFDAWGQPLVTTQTNAQQYRYTGKELDPDFVDFNSVNRRYHYLFRSLVPYRGSFIQVDPLIRPLRQVGTFNWLGDIELLDPVQLLTHSPYALREPISKMDPLGLQEKGERVDSDKQQEDLEDYPLTKSINCDGSPALLQKVKDALETAYHKVIKWSPPRGPGLPTRKANEDLPPGPYGVPHPNRFRRKMLSCFGKVTVICDYCCPKDKSGRPVCGWRDGNDVHLCMPAAIDPAKCGNLSGTIVHEVSHCAGAIDPGPIILDPGNVNAYDIDQYYFPK